MTDRDARINVWLAHWEETTEAMGAPASVLRRIRTIRRVADSDHPDRDRVCLELLADLGRVYEAAMRRGGHHGEADALARWAESIETWLELPADLRAVAGRPLESLE